MYLPSKVKPLCPPEQAPWFADIAYAQVTLPYLRGDCPPAAIFHGARDVVVSLKQGEPL